MMKVARVLLGRNGSDNMESLVLRSADSIVVARKRLPKGVSPLCTLDKDVVPEAPKPALADTRPEANTRPEAARLVETKSVPTPKGVRFAI